MSVVMDTLPKGVVKSLDKAQGGLSVFVEDARAAFEAMPSDWQDGDCAADISSWLDELEELVERLAECTASAF